MRWKQENPQKFTGQLAWHRGQQTSHPTTGKARTDIHRPARTHMNTYTQSHITRFKRKKGLLGMVLCPFSPSTHEADSGRSL